MAVLSPAFVARLETLQLRAGRKLAGHLAGEHTSPRIGSSLDLAGHRPYAEGDDVRRIDHQVLARLDVALVRLFDAEDDLEVRLLLDTSGSMAGAKLTQATRVAGAIGVVALAARDAVTIRPLGTQHRPRRCVGRAAVATLLAALESIEAHGPSPLAAAALDLASQPGAPGMTVLVSDLLAPDWPEALRRLPARGAAVVVVHVLARSDLDPAADPNLVGDVDVVDVESGRVVSVSLTPAVRARFVATATAWADEVAVAARAAGATYLRVFDDDDIETTLLTAWRTAGVLR